MTDAFDWRASLKRWRTDQGITQRALASKAGLSLDAIKAYESGRRRPTADALLWLIHALGIPRDEGNRILGGAGYAIDWGALFEGRYAPCTMEELQEEADSCQWPAFVTNDTFDVIAQNHLFERVLEVDGASDLLGFGERNLLGGVTHERFVERLLNWDEVVSFMCGLVRGDSRWGSRAPNHAAPWLQKSLRHMQAGNPERVKRLAELWETATPIPGRIRYRYRIRWRCSDGAALAFSARMVLANLWTEVHWHEWIPADRKTWQWLANLPREGGGAGDAARPRPQAVDGF